jgi:ABC-type glycerol-3-phosphate transport system substrate-binding protein
MAVLFSALVAVAVGAVTLQFLTFAWQEEEVEQVEAIVEEWNAARPDIQVQIIYQLLENINDFLSTGFQVGEGPDLFHEESVMCYEYGLQGYAEPLNRYLDAGTLADTPQKSWDGVSDDDGNIYGIPFLQETLVIFYNKAMLVDAGITPPTDGMITWAELRDYAQRLTRRNANGETTTWGLLAPLEQRLWWCLVAQNGGQVLVKYPDGTWHVEIDEAGRQAIGFYTDLVTVDQVMPKEVLSYDFMSLFQGFKSGKYAMFSFGCWVRNWIGRLIGTSIEWGMLQVKGPVRTVTEAGPQGISIYAGSRHKDQAAEFLLYYTNTENQARLAHADGLFPVRQTAAARPEFRTAEDQWDVAYQWLSYAEDVKPHMFGFYNWEWQSFVPQIELILLGAQSLDDALRAATENGNEFLRRMGLQ